MKFFTILILLLLPLSAIAEGGAFDCAKPLVTDSDFLGKVQAAYARTASIEAEFEQESYLAALDLAEKSNGTAWFLMPGKMRWDYKAPEEQQFLFKDSTVWLYQKIDNQVLIQDVPQVLVSDLPVSFMLGLGNIDKQFTLKKLCNSEKGIVADLTPAKKGLAEDEGLEALSLLFNEGEYFPTGAMITQKGGNTTKILFRQMKFNGETNDKLFEAKFPKNVDVIDIRDG